jgi:Polyketide cyclase / dehydrase and lipid transport.
MLTTVISTEVNVPVRTAYHQWTQFEDFPQFMEGVSKSRRSMPSACIGKPRSQARKRNG